jgi:hypothetical protein
MQDLVKDPKYYYRFYKILLLVCVPSLISLANTLATDRAVSLEEPRLMPLWTSVKLETAVPKVTFSYGTREERR